MTGSGGLEDIPAILYFLNAFNLQGTCLEALLLFWSYLIYRKLLEDLLSIKDHIEAFSPKILSSTVPVFYQ